MAHEGMFSEKGWRTARLGAGTQEASFQFAHVGPVALMAPGIKTEHIQSLVTASMK